MNNPQVILVIEDDPAMRMGLKDNLEIEGYRVICSSTAKEGKKAATSGVDLVLLDLMLPDSDGIKLCKELRGMGVVQPVIMLTARGEEMDKVIGLESGADDYLVKPFENEMLISAIRHALRLREADLHELELKRRLQELTIHISALVEDIETHKTREKIKELIKLVAEIHQMVSEESNHS